MSSHESPGAAKAAPGPFIAGAVLLAVGVLLLIQAISAGQERGVVLGGPTLAPIIVTGIWVLVAAAYLLGQFRDRSVAVGEKPRWRTPFLLLAGLVGYAIVLKYTLVGYVIATTIFFVLSARMLSVRPLREVIVRDVCVAVGLSLGIYLVFTRLLGIVLPAGVLPL